MRPAGPSRGVLDPATYHTSKSIANAMRGGGAGSGQTSIPATLLVLIALAVALPALSFFAMHARVLDHQQTLTENYAVRHEATTIRSARASIASSDGALFGRRVLDAQPFSPTRFPDSSPHPCFLCFLSDDDGGTDDCEKGSERDARDWFGSAGRTRGARPREAGAAGCRGAREGKGVLRRRNDAESPQGRRRGCGGLERRKGTGDRSMILLFLLPSLSLPSTEHPREEPRDPSATWRCCSGRIRTGACGTRTSARWRRTEGTWMCCGGRTRTGARWTRRRGTTPTSVAART